jgi:hypothetical protein
MQRIEFKCKVVRLVYTQENFKIYAAEVDTEKYPFIELNEYGNVTILGDIHVLTLGSEYIVSAFLKLIKGEFLMKLKI